MATHHRAHSRAIAVAAVVVSLLAIGDSACDGASESVGAGSPPRADGGPSDGAKADGYSQPFEDSGEDGSPTAEGGAPLTSFTVDVPNVVRRSNIVLDQPNMAPHQFM